MRGHDGKFAAGFEHRHTSSIQWMNPQVGRRDVFDDVRCHCTSTLSLSNGQGTASGRARCPPLAGLKVDPDPRRPVCSGHSRCPSDAGGFAHHIGQSRRIGDTYAKCCLRHAVTYENERTHRSRLQSWLVAQLDDANVLPPNSVPPDDEKNAPMLLMFCVDVT